LSVIAAEPPIAPAQPRGAQLRRFARRNPTIVAGGIILSIITLMAIFAPLFTGDAITMHPAQRLRPPSDANLLGTDHLGRDIFARTVYGARVSLFVGVALLIGGVVITETVFNIPGVGRLVVDAISKRDYPIIQGVILMFSGVYVLVNLAVDMSYTLLDPRIRY